ncbi:MAG: type II toxin-antitoxin system VapC family toxin [Parvularculaceae bacterium]
MFIDASAIVAILARESGHAAFIDRIVETSSRLSVSPLVRLESVLALARTKGVELGHAVRTQQMTEECDKLYDKFIDRIEADEMAISGEIGRAALSAYARYGKGGGHPASLNLIDCFSYACAKSLGVGLLYKGVDFAQTDVG